MPKRKPVDPVPSEAALDFVRRVEERFDRERIEKLSDQELEAELSRMAGGREELEGIKRRILMDVFKRPQPRSKGRRGR